MGAPTVPALIERGDLLSVLSPFVPTEDNTEFMWAIDTRFAELSFPPTYLQEPFQNRTFEALMALPDGIVAGRIAPWFGQPGGGLQYHFPKGIRWYVNNGYIVEVR